MSSDFHSFNFRFVPYRKLVFLSLFLWFLCLPGKATDFRTDFVRSLHDKTSDQRIKALELMLDTLDASRKTAAHLGVVLADFMHLAESSSDFNLKQRVLFIERIQSKYMEPDPRKHIELYTRVKSFYDRQNQPLYSAICLHYIGQNQFVLGDYGPAFKNLLKAHESFLKIGLEKIPEIGLYLHNLALDHYFFKEYEQAIALMEVAMKHAAFSSNLDIQRYNTLACSYRSLGQLDKAELFFKKTYQKAVDHRDSTWMGIALRNTGDILFRKENYLAALTYFQQAVELLSDNTFYPILGKQAVLHQVEVLIKLGRYEEAWKNILLLREFSEKNRRTYFGEHQEYESFLKRYHEVLRHYYFHTNHYRAAYLHLDTASRLSNEYLKVYGKEQVKAVNDYLKIQEQQTRLELGDKEKQLLSIRFWALVCFGVIIALAFFVWSYRTKLKDEREKNQLLLRQRLLEVEQQKTQEQLTEARAKLKEYIKKIQEKTAPAGAHSEHLIINPEPSGEKGASFHHTIEKLKNTKILTKEDWGEFRALFYRAFPFFPEEISKIYHQPTPSELRYLMLQKIGLSSPEMADLLGVSSDSIRVTRHRLNRKRYPSGSHKKSAKLPAS